MSDAPKGGKTSSKSSQERRETCRKKGGKIGGISEKKRKRRRKENYGIYIYNVFRHVHPDVGVSSKAMSIMNSFVNDIFERIASGASRCIVVSFSIFLSVSRLTSYISISSFRGFHIYHIRFLSSSRSLEFSSLEVKYDIFRY